MLTFGGQVLRRRRELGKSIQLSFRRAKLKCNVLPLHIAKFTQSFSDIARDGFPIDDARARAQAGERFDNQPEAASHVIAGTAVEPHAVAILACEGDGRAGRPRAQADRLF
jgi:hypothetical protein